jgi:hypothetical protein
MYARVVRFTDASIDQINARSDEQGPPDGVNPKSIQILFDKDQNTSVVFITFETEEDMRNADAALQAMDSGETPGTRASVDQGEIVRTIEP